MAFVLFLGLALALWHNAFFAPLNTQVGVFGDAQEYAWFLGWMPYALGHGLNPLMSTFVNFPHGVNLMWNTSVLLPSFLMSPVTVIFGAAFSYNVLMTLAPALSSTFAYIAFRRWTGRIPSLAGAAIFGFSPFMISQSVGHVAQVLMLSAPLFLIVLDRLLVVQSSKPWLDGLMLGLLAWAQLLTGEEILAMEGVVAAIAVVVLAAINDRAIVAHVRYAFEGLLVAAGSFLVLSAPFLAYQYRGPDRVQDVHPYNAYVTDVYNFFVPTSVTKFAPTAALRTVNLFTGNGSEQGAYIGIPLLAFILLTLVIARRRRVTWVAFAIAGTAALLSMGPSLHVRGHITTFELPDAWLQDLPFFHNVLPDRFASVMWVGVGLLVALGLEELKRFKPPVMALGWTVAALGVASLFPITNFPSATSPRYAAFEAGLDCPLAGTASSASLRPVALVVPSIDEMALRWQEEARFCFVMASDTGMTGTNTVGTNLNQRPMILSVGQPGAALPPLSAGIREQAAKDIQELHIKEVIVAPEYPYSGPVPWSPSDQAQLIAWFEGLLGQVPVQSHDPYRSYAWKDLPSVRDIATGHVAYVRGAL